ncbi:unnamed protein product [Lactuca saligna]|uniref:Uncharacterized protein n=1 Tax=Lactuca saligna TaxID=75948 RepID=A0AA35V8H5_LACSI|nr:unnamed protein product [Lactuca saligna]
MITGNPKLLAEVLNIPIVKQNNGGHVAWKPWLDDGTIFRHASLELNREDAAFLFRSFHNDVSPIATRDHTPTIVLGESDVSPCRFPFEWAGMEVAPP